MNVNYDNINNLYAGNLTAIQFNLIVDITVDSFTKPIIKGDYRKGKEPLDIKTSKTYKLSRILRLKIIKALSRLVVGSSFGPDF